MGDIDFLQPAKGEGPQPPEDKKREVEYTPGQKVEAEKKEHHPRQILKPIVRRSAIPLPPAPEEPKRKWFSIWRREHQKRQQEEKKPLPVLKMPDLSKPKIVPITSKVVPPLAKSPNVSTALPVTPKFSPAQAKVVKKSAKKSGVKFSLPKEEKGKIPTALQSMGVNLVPKQVSVTGKHRHQPRDLGYVAILVIVVLLIIQAGFWYYRRQINVNITGVDEEIMALKEKISSFSALQVKAAETNDYLQSVDEVLSRHYFWTPLVNFLEQNTLPTVYYKDLVGSALTREFTLTAIAPNYQHLETQLNILKQAAEVEEVNVSGVSRVSITPEEIEEQKEETSSVKKVKEKEETTKEGEEATNAIEFKIYLKFKQEIFSP